MRTVERITGGISGVLLGDALGLPVQFQTREQIRTNPVQGMSGYGTFNLPPGTWSDDGSLTLCLAAGLQEAGYNLEDIGQRFLRWQSTGVQYLCPFG